MRVGALVAQSRERLTGDCFEELRVGWAQLLPPAAGVGCRWLRKQRMILERIRVHAVVIGEHPRLEVELEERSHATELGLGLSHEVLVAELVIALLPDPAAQVAGALDLQ